MGRSWVPVDDREREGGREGGREDGRYGQGEM